MASNPGVVEETLSPSRTVGFSSHSEIIEINFSMNTGSFRGAVRVDDCVRAKTLKTIFGSIKVDSIECEVRQETLVGPEQDDLIPSGHIFVAIIPTGKNTDVATGTTSGVILMVPNKQSFPLSAQTQTSRVFHFDITGYESDLAVEPRKQQGIVVWCGNTGVTKKPEHKANLPICTLTWRVRVSCSGNSTLW